MQRLIYVGLIITAVNEE